MHHLQSSCRSAFKLLEIDQKTKFMRPGQVILDCGAAPGSWTQIAVQKSNANGDTAGQPKGTVIGIDLLQIYPIAVSDESPPLVNRFKSSIALTLSGCSHFRQHRFPAAGSAGENPHSAGRSPSGLRAVGYGTECDRRSGSRSREYYESVLHGAAVCRSDVGAVGQHFAESLGQWGGSAAREGYAAILWIGEDYQAAGEQRRFVGEVSARSRVSRIDERRRRRTGCVEIIVNKLRRCDLQAFQIVETSS